MHPPWRDFGWAHVTKAHAFKPSSKQEGDPREALTLSLSSWTLLEPGDTRGCFWRLLAAGFLQTLGGLVCGLQQTRVSKPEPVTSHQELCGRKPLSTVTMTQQRPRTRAKACTRPHQVRNFSKCRNTQSAAEQTTSNAISHFSSIKANRGGPVLESGAVQLLYINETILSPQWSILIRSKWDAPEM